MDKTLISRKKPSEAEFVVLIAFLMSLVALSIDMMLPALPTMGRDLGVGDGNEIQQVVSMLFIGLTLAQIIYGPLSDRFGRKAPVALGIFIFILGSVVCATATDFDVMLVGRVIQGVGIAALKIVTVAMVRDQYDGERMARIMSLAMSIFIIVPCVAPVLGQVVLAVAHWRAIFGVFIALGTASFVWFWLRQPETLGRAKRIPLEPWVLLDTTREVLTNRVAMRHTIAASLINGAFLGYLMSSSQILQGIYQSGDWFAVYFAILAGALGIASLVNAKLVIAFGMQRLSMLSLCAMIAASGILFAVAVLASDTVPLWIFIGLMAVVFFAFGFSFGNLNAIAMEPIGHIAGAGASILGLISGLVMILIGQIIGMAFDGTIIPLAAGFLITAIVALCLARPSRDAAAEYNPDVSPA